MSKFATKTPKRQRAVQPRSVGHPPTLQVAALCYRVSAKGTRILLITSRETGRWIIPKGWPMRNRTEAQAAAREAYEEAGLKGEVGEESIGFYTYLKRLPDRAVPCMVRLYPLEVREMLRKYPETGQRRIKWFSQAKAARKVREPELAACIRDFDPAWRDPRPEPDPEPDPDPGPRAAPEPEPAVETGPPAQGA